MQARAGIRPAVPSSFFTMSNSPLRGIRRAAHLVPAAHFLRPGCRVVLLCLHRISPLHVPALRRARARILGVSCSSDPEMRGRRSAGRRTTLFVAPVRRDLTLARRARPAQPGRPPLGAPPWRCPGPAASPAFPPEPGQGWLADHVHGRLRTPGSTAVTSRGRRHTPLRRQDRLRKTPLMSEDGNPCTINSLRSQ